MNEPESAQRIESYLEDNIAHYRDMLQQMVAVNSFTANAAGVNELGQLTIELFADLGMTAETVQSNNPQYGRHLILTRQAESPDAPKIGLISHLDTVFPPEEEILNDFHWRVEGDRIYGPGVVDIKGGTVMIYMILSALKANYPQQFAAVTWIVLLDASEETGGGGFNQLCLERLDVRTLAALVFEPGDWNGKRPHLVVARKGIAVYRVEVQGKAAHAGSAHDQGANAVVQLAEVIGRIGALTDYDRELTFNVGTAHGGTVPNRVPHFAYAEVEMRAFDEAVYAEGFASMMALGQLSSVRAQKGDFDCRVNVAVMGQVYPWSRNIRTDRLFMIWQETAEGLGFEAYAEQRGGLSDGNYLWQDLPTLDGLGPAGANAHCSQRSEDDSKDQEYVRADTFVPKALLNMLAILSLIEQGYE